MVDLSGISPNMGQQTVALPSSAKGADAALLRNSNVVDQPVKVPAVEKSEIRTFEDKRYNKVVESAKSYAADFFAIADTRFTIFKDGSGQYITRFTNLRDGTVTYFPEPEILAYMERKGAEREAFYEMNA